MKSGSYLARVGTLASSVVVVIACSSSDGFVNDTIDISDGTDTTSEPETDEESDTTNEVTTDTVIDIYDAVFTERSVDCADYANVYDATVTDIKNSITFNADITIEATDTECIFTSNSVPNHDFNDESAAFAGGAEGATISEIDSVSIVTRTPSFAAEPTPISQEVKNAIFLNGVRLDIIAAGCYDPTNPDALEDGNFGRGCASFDPWVLDPLGFEGNFGVDIHNGHTQPGGGYHYHGEPNAMYDDNPGSEGSPVIGFAADGFPVYGGYFYDSDTGQVRQALSGYTLKQGSRGERSDTNPGGVYDGTYNDDWEFTDAGDLDACNGMFVDDQYGYYVTKSYPWVIKCLQGTPHESFVTTAGNEGGQEGPGGGGQGGQEGPGGGQGPNQTPG